MAHKTIRRISILAALALLNACASTPKKTESTAVPARAQWETKLRIEDLKRDKSHNLSVDVLGEKGGNLRLEATAILGFPVASYVMTHEGFRCALYNQKTFYEGPLGDAALQPLVRFPLSPVVLSRIAFDQPIVGPDWTCRQSAAGLVDSCESPSRRLVVGWKREGETRTVRIAHPDYVLTWVFGEPKTDVRFKAETFQLPPPAGFRLMRL